ILPSFLLRSLHWITNGNLKRFPIMSTPLSPAPGVSLCALLWAKKLFQVFLPRLRLSVIAVAFRKRRRTFTVGRPPYARSEIPDW
ncbi:6085_t:CDS:2, partial [Funneliformis mosseae]